MRVGMKLAEQMRHMQQDQGFVELVRQAISGDQQTGYVVQSGAYRAALWRGSAASYVDLAPPGSVHSMAYATDGVHQWGFQTFNTPQGARSHAGYWSGTAASFVSFNPDQGRNSAIRGVGGGQQVGYTTLTSAPGTYAALWNGSPESWLDLHPFPGYGQSEVYATTGAVQVGWSHIPGSSFPHAGVWFGSASSFIDLNQVLPAGFGGEALASCVVTIDGVTTIGGYATGPSGQHQAVLWTIVPAPTVPAFLVAALPLVAARRRR